MRREKSVICSPWIIYPGRVSHVLTMNKNIDLLLVLQVNKAQLNILYEQGPGLVLMVPIYGAAVAAAINTSQSLLHTKYLLWSRKYLRRNSDEAGARGGWQWACYHNRIKAIFTRTISLYRDPRPGLHIMFTSAGPAQATSSGWPTQY